MKNVFLHLMGYGRYGGSSTNMTRMPEITRCQGNVSDNFSLYFFQRVGLGLNEDTRHYIE